MAQTLNRSTTARDLAISAAGIAVAMVGLLLLSRAGLRPATWEPPAPIIPFWNLHPSHVFNRLPEDYMRTSIRVSRDSGVERVYEWITPEFRHTVQIFDLRGKVYEIIATCRHTVAERAVNCASFIPGVAALARMDRGGELLNQWASQNFGNVGAETTILGVRLEFLPSRPGTHVLRVTSTSPDFIPPSDTDLPGALSNGQLPIRKKSAG